MIGQIQLIGILFIGIGFGLFGLAIALLYKFMKKRKEEKQEEEEDNPLRLLE